MCGIAGRFDLSQAPGGSVDREGLMLAMIDLMAHRGPDESGYLVDPRAAICAVRLKIVDLLHGQQPMGDPTGRWWIVYNGEVYNHPELRSELQARGHRFTSRCDTEVVLRAWIEWGTEAPARLEGGFAFAIYDRLRGEAHLVRDRFGKRPLFYRWAERALMFGSEMKVFLADPTVSMDWDDSALASIFGQWTGVDGETPYRGVRQVPAGCMLHVGARGARESRYASFPMARRDSEVPLEEQVEQVRELLLGSVQRRLRADVDVGVMLSGGLDSAIVAQLVHQAQPGRMQSFSIGFDDPRFDESTDQQLLVREFGFEHTAIRVGATQIAAAFEDALWHAEIPQFRTAFVPMYLLSRRIREAGIRVVLSGEGADEVFLGYDLFKETRLRVEWPGLSAEERRERLRRLYPYLPHFNEANLRALEVVLGRSAHGADELLFSHALRLENGRFAQRLLHAPPPATSSLAAAAQAAGLAGADPLARAQWLEVHSLLQGYLLSSQGDRMAFAHGVEPRNPFLAPELVEFASRLPETSHLSSRGEEKRLLKQAFGAVLPARILGKPKQPYRAPDVATFHAPGGGFLPWVEELLEPASLAAIGPLDDTQANRLVAKLRADTSKAVSPREEQALVLLLSLSSLDRQWVRRERLSVARRSRPPLRRALLLPAMA